MSNVRLLVGTRKGAFVLTSDGKRKKWEVSGPHFAGWEVYHLKASPVQPDRIYASQSSSWFGQIIQRSDDGGKTWNPPGGEKMPGPFDPPGGLSNRFLYEGEVGKRFFGEELLVAETDEPLADLPGGEAEIGGTELLVDVGVTHAGADEDTFAG